MPPSHPLEFSICWSISNDFTLVESLWSPLQDKVYFVGGEAAAGLWRLQQWSPSWILSRIRNHVKTSWNGDFLSLRWKITHKQALRVILATRFICIVKKKIKKNMYFHSKVAWAPPSYDVLSRYHRKWPSLNSTQNAREGWKNSYWKQGGVSSNLPYPPHPPPPFVRPRVKGKWRTFARKIKSNWKNWEKYYAVTGFFFLFFCQVRISTASYEYFVK